MVFGGEADERSPAGGLLLSRVHPWWPGAGGGFAVTGLGGTGRLADDLWLLAHDDRTGKPHLQPRATGLGLGGALLAELMLSQRIQLWQGTVVATSGPPPGDDLAGWVLELVTREPAPLPVGDWLLFLARTAAGDIAVRLGRAGYLRRVRKGRFSRERWVPVDADCAFAPLTRIQATLRGSGPVAAQDAVLGGLAAACGLGHQMELYLPPKAVRHVEEAPRYLDPGLRDLIAHTKAAVDAALLSHRVSHPV